MRRVCCVEVEIEYPFFGACSEATQIEAHDATTLDATP